MKSKSNLGHKHQHLKAILTELQNVLISFSGGVDSSVLLHEAHKANPDGLNAVIIDSPTFTHDERERAIRIARGMGIEPDIVSIDELSHKGFTANPPERCFICKQIRFKALEELRENFDLVYIIDGTNIDDLSDWRPGLKAAQEFNVKSPLVEAGLNKEDIREIARISGLPNWDAPSNACLASRIPYGQEITMEKLEQIKKAELVLCELGFLLNRVRHHGGMASIEVPLEQLEQANKYMTTLDIRLKELGFECISIDPAGFRSGSLNEIINPAHKNNISEDNI